MSDMELRMYGFVPYSLSGIQKGIQFGHAVVEHGLKSNNDLYNEWAKNHKTFIILNGGTTNNNPSKLGSINELYNSFIENDIMVTGFSEPDLGDQLTAFVFIVSEQVFDKRAYPDFIDYVYEKHYYAIFKVNSEIHPKEITYEKFLNGRHTQKISIAKEWMEMIGGEKNYFMREKLKHAKLA